MTFVANDSVSFVNLIVSLLSAVDFSNIFNQGDKMVEMNNQNKPGNSLL